MKYVISKLGPCEKPVYPESDYGDTQSKFIGVSDNPPTVGQSFCLLSIKSRSRSICTSEVIKVDKNTFTTLNSIYSWKEIE